jgi:hypothetical protein
MGKSGQQGKVGRWELGVAYNGDAVIVDVCLVMKLLLDLGVVILGRSGRVGLVTQPLTREQFNSKATGVTH